MGKLVLALAVLIGLAGSPSFGQDAYKTVNPQTLADGRPVGYSQVTIAKPGQLIFMSGQVGWDANKQIVGDGSFSAQTMNALENVRLALEAAGATSRDVALIRYYIVALDRERVETMAQIVRDSGMWDPDSPPVGTVLGVDKLAFDELLIEIEAIAVVPD